MLNIVIFSQETKHDGRTADGDIRRQAVRRGADQIALFCEAAAKPGAKTHARANAAIAAVSRRSAISVLPRL